MNLSPEVAAMLRQALDEAENAKCRDYDTDGAFSILVAAIDNLLEPQPVAPASECENCGQHLPNFLGDDGLCPQCEEEYDEQVAEYEADQRLETALACKCGAWGINPVTSNVYHCADCVCGAE